MGSGRRERGGRGGVGLDRVMQPQGRGKGGGEGGRAVGKAEGEGEVDGVKSVEGTGSDADNGE